MSTDHFIQLAKHLSQMGPKKNLDTVCAVLENQKSTSIIIFDDHLCKKVIVDFVNWNITLKPNFETNSIETTFSIKIDWKL